MAGNVVNIGGRNIATANKKKYLETYINSKFNDRAQSKRATLLFIELKLL